jgi:hypothetical protein
MNCWTLKVKDRLDGVRYAFDENILKTRQYGVQYGFDMNFLDS